MEVVNNNARLRNEIGFQHAYAKPKDLLYSLKDHIVYVRGNIDKASQDHDFNRLFLDVIRTLTDNSQALFDSLLDPGVAQYACSRLLGDSPDPAPATPPPVPTNVDPNQPSDPENDAKSAGSLLNEKGARVSPEEVLLYLDTSSSSYGKWPVFVAERAISDLKNLSTNSPELFALVQPKIKELSLGCFSPANQTALLKRDYGIPLYRANLTTDINIIYQIDCGAPVVDRTGNKQESQCIRVFGIYHDNDIDPHFWTSVAKVLGKHEEEYRHRQVAFFAVFHPWLNSEWLRLDVPAAHHWRLVPEVLNA
ncbi:hypothetical protein FRB99_000978 [Tulasnella sp. 403]|nr:hypothetical protein FRB99_000978 [Tulasnella sp. 403]